MAHDFVWNREAIPEDRQSRPHRVGHAAFILDDTTDRRVGQRRENVSYVFDHVIGKTLLGFKHLVLGFFDGTTFIPLDFSIHAEQRLRGRKRQEQYRKIC